MCSAGLLGKKDKHVCLVKYVLCTYEKQFRFPASVCMVCRGDGPPVMPGYQTETQGIPHSKLVSKISATDNLWAPVSDFGSIYTVESGGGRYLLKVSHLTHTCTHC